MKLARETVKAMNHEGKLYARLIEEAQPKMQLPHPLTLKWHCHYDGFSPELRFFKIDIEHQSPYFDWNWANNLQNELARVLERKCFISGTTFRSKKIAWIPYCKVYALCLFVFRLGHEPIVIPDENAHEL